MCVNVWGADADTCGKYISYLNLFRIARGASEKWRAGGGHEQSDGYIEPCEHVSASRQEGVCGMRSFATRACAFSMCSFWMFIWILETSTGVCRE